MNVMREKAMSRKLLDVDESYQTDEELEVITLQPYILGAKFCRRMHKCGGVCIFRIIFSILLLI